MKRIPFLLFFCGLGFFIRASAQPIQVYFSTDSSAISLTEYKKIQQLVEKLRSQEGTWTLEGRASSSGSEGHNLALSQRRTQAVKQVLLNLGITEAHIRSQSKGELLAQKADDFPSDRVVLLSFSPRLASPIVTPTPTASPKPNSSITVHVVVKDAITRRSIGGEAFPANASLKQTFTPPGVDLAVPQNGSLSVHFGAQGYRDTTYVFTGDQTLYTVELLPKNVLGKLVFQNIYFYPNSPEIVPESKRALEQLLLELQKFPDAHIQIRGHVNFPGLHYLDTKTNLELLDLSEKRAYAVMRWLSKNGIPEKHMSALGLGNTQMLFPMATTEGQQAQNRRVEILLFNP